MDAAPNRASRVVAARQSSCSRAPRRPVESAQRGGRRVIAVHAVCCAVCRVPCAVARPDVAERHAGEARTG